MRSGGMGIVMKTLKIITALTILFVFAFSLSASARTLYVPDGRTAEVSEQDVQRWESVGWYSYPVATLYALDGRTVAVRTSDVPAWGCGEYYWTLSSNERKTARISYPAVQKIAFADWSVWLR